MRQTRPSDKSWKTLRAYFVLLRKGFSARNNHLLVCALLPHIFTLTTGFHPWRYILCGTFRRISPPTLVFLQPCVACFQLGVQTFLTNQKLARPSRQPHALIKKISETIYFALNLCGTVYLVLRISIPRFANLNRRM